MEGVCSRVYLQHTTSKGVQTSGNTHESSKKRMFNCCLINLNSVVHRHLDGGMGMGDREGEWITEHKRWATEHKKREYMESINLKKF